MTLVKPCFTEGKSDLQDHEEVVESTRERIDKFEGDEVESFRKIKFFASGKHSCTSKLDLSTPQGYPGSRPADTSKNTPAVQRAAIL